jgi:hypothetical protein
MRSCLYIILLDNRKLSLQTWKAFPAEDQAFRKSSTAFTNAMLDDKRNGTVEIARC